MPRHQIKRTTTEMNTMSLRLIRELYTEAVLRCFWNYCQVTVILEKNRHSCGTSPFSSLCFYCIGDVTFATVYWLRIRYLWERGEKFLTNRTDITNVKTPNHLMPTVKMEKYIILSWARWDIGKSYSEASPSELRLVYLLIDRLIIFLRASIKLP